MKEQKVKEFLGKFFDVNGISSDDNIFELGLVHSLFAMQLVQFIEREFDIAIDNDDLDIDNFKSINSIIGLIDKKTN